MRDRYKPLGFPTIDLRGCALGNRDAITKARRIYREIGRATFKQVYGWRDSSINRLLETE